MKVVVEIVSGARSGKRYEFDDPGLVRFGRHPSNDVTFDPERDRDASSRHAELRREGDTLFLFDLNSANGTRIGGAPTGPRTLVPPGTEIEFGAGGPRCRVSYDAVSASTVPPTLFKPAAQKPATATGQKGSLVGQRTVMMMIDQALKGARGTSRRLQIVAVSLGVALLLTLAGVVVAFTVRPPPDVALRREMVKVMEQQRAASASERAALQQKLDEMAQRLAKAGGAQGGSAIARTNHDAIFLVTVKTSVEEQGFCTAFAIATDRLITNAHCVALAEDYRRRGGDIYVLQNGHADVRLKIERMKRIAGFSPNSAGISPDVGWLKVDGKLPIPVTLASKAELGGVATGDQMYTYGFPGRLADVSAPEATFVEGVVGRITTLDGRVPGPPGTKEAQGQLIQHSAYTSGGTSGSPIFNGAGHVVAVNTGGYADAPSAAAKPGGEAQVVSRSLPGYNFGMRVDLVEDLLKEGDE